MKNTIKKIKWPKNLNMEEWGKLRQEMEGISDPDIVRIGASDIGVVMGTSSFKEKRRLFMHLTGFHSQFQLTERTVQGHLLEPIIANRWMCFDPDEQTALLNTHHNIKVRKIKKAEFFLLNTKYPNFFVSLDYIPADKKQYSPFTGELYHPLTPNEAKTTSKGYYIQWKNGITKAYYDQVQTQLLITETPVAVFHVLVDGVNYKVMEIPADYQRQQEIVDGVSEFAMIVKDGKLALKSWREAEAMGNLELAEKFENLYYSLCPDYEGTDDSVYLADELWQPPIDPDANFKPASEDENKMMNEYWDYLRLEETIKKEKNILQANLKDASSGWEGIKSEEFKLINRAATSTKGKYFSVKKLGS